MYKEPGRLARFFYITSARDVRARIAACIGKKLQIECSNATSRIIIPKEFKNCEVVRLSTEVKFTVIAEEIIDDDLTLLLARGGGVPRLGIFNTYNDKKKYVPLSWVEGAGRSLKIKVGKKTKEYSMDMVIEGVGELIKNSADEMSLNSLAWRGVQLIGDLVNMPKTARSDADLNLIQESKRDTLWYVYTPRRGNWRVRPCFVTTEGERAVLEKYVEGDKPWPAISIENGGLPSTLRNMPFVKEIVLTNPKRWTEFMLPLAKCMLLGFSDWSPAGEQVFCDALWKYLPLPTYRSEDSIATISSEARFFINKLIAYLRLWPLLNEAKIEFAHDAAKIADERGWKKRERFEMVAANLGDKRFKVTRFVSEEGSLVAFMIVPDARLPGEEDRIVSMAESSWETGLEACSLGGEKDPQYTCNSIIGAIETRDWHVRINGCMMGQSAGGKSGDGGEDE
jgi:hypothetical protein